MSWKANLALLLSFLLRLLLLLLFLWQSVWSLNDTAGGESWAQGARWEQRNRDGGW